MTSNEPAHRATRRKTLVAITALLGSWLLGAPPAIAKGKPKPRRKPRLRRATRGRHGVTLHFELSSAPFPHRGSRYDDATVLVFVPRHYRLPKSRQIDAVVHFHGHNNTAMSALRRHLLREQLHDSKQNAILIAPQGPHRARDSSGGKLDDKNGLRRMFAELLRELTRSRVNRALGKTRLASAKRFGHVCLSAHSGGYRVAASCLRRGGVDINEVYLFDALYGQVAAFESWVVAGKGKRGRQRHKLVSHYATAAVRKHNDKLIKRLRKAGVKVLHERKLGGLTRAQFTQGSAVFIAAPTSHSAVTFRHNGLRDCLYASGFKRRLRSNWFRNKNARRKIDRRGG